MRQIKKQTELEILTKWKRQNPTARYGDIDRKNPLDYKLVSEIRNACTKEQFYLCAYCCDKISGNASDTINEHVIAKDIEPERSLDFSNIVASCSTRHQCDSAHGSQEFLLTPLMPECESELKFSISGQVEGLTDRAKESIRVLNLGDSEKNNRSLIRKRHQLSMALLFCNGINHKDGLEDNNLLYMVIDDLMQPNNGRLEAFSPVAVNILRTCCGLI